MVWTMAQSKPTKATKSGRAAKALDEQLRTPHTKARKRTGIGGDSDGAAAQDTTARDRQMFDDICGDLSLRIGWDGTWYYHDSPIGRLPLVKLFASVLRRDAEGEYWLVTPVEKGRIAVEDVPFVAVELSAQGEGAAQDLTVRTNLDEFVVVGPDHPLRVDHDIASGEPRPYVLIRDGLEARLNRPTFYQLVELGEEVEENGEAKLGVWSGGEFFMIGSLEREGA
jgi:hypothetical protein